MNVINWVAAGAGYYYKRQITPGKPTAWWWRGGRRRVLPGRIDGRALRYGSSEPRIGMSGLGSGLLSDLIREIHEGTFFWRWGGHSDGGDWNHFTRTTPIG